VVVEGVSRGGAGLFVGEDDGDSAAELEARKDAEVEVAVEVEDEAVEAEAVEAGETVS
jgi:hypothetical protein